MSPIRPCPICQKDTNFHPDEPEESAFCLDCGMETAKAAFILEMAAGEHNHLIQDEEQEDECSDDDE
jgi:hypothetical protein